MVPWRRPLRCGVLMIFLPLAACTTGRVDPEIGGQHEPQHSARDTPVQAPGSWRDASPHAVRFVTVDGARLHVLDWGGRGDVAKGDVLVLLHGYASNAHVFDDLAPRFTDRFRVLALTERGFGESGAGGDRSRYSLDGAAEDLRAVLDSLHVGRAVLAAHSMGGWVMARFAIRHPDRVTQLVFLDAAFDVNASDSIVARRPVVRPAPVGLRSPEDVMRWLARFFYGMWTPALEAEYRARPEDEDVRAASLAPLLADHHAHPREFGIEFDRVHQPALAVCAAATPASEFPWLTPDSARYVDAARYVADVRRPFQLAECERFAGSAPDRTAVVVDGGHYIFVTALDRTVRAVRAFLR